MNVVNLLGRKWDSAVVSLSGDFQGEIPIGNNTLLMGVDRGTHHFIKRGILPTLVIGDLDSIEFSQVYRLIEMGKPWFILSHWDKDYTDGEWAIRIARSLGIKEVLIIGLMGGEMDHFLGNLSLFSMYSEDFNHLVGYTGYQTIELVENRLYYHLPVGTPISFVPYDDVVKLTLKGVHWEVKEQRYHRKDLPPISNIVVSPTVEIIAEGKVWVIIGRKDKPYLLK